MDTAIIRIGTGTNWKRYSSLACSIT